MFSLSDWKNKIIIHLKEMKKHKDGVFILAWYTFILFIILTIVTVSVAAGGKVKGKDKAPLALGSRGGGNGSGGKDAREGENEEVENYKNGKTGRTTSNTGSRVNTGKKSQNRNGGNKQGLKGKQNFEAEEAETDGELDEPQQRVTKRKNNSQSKYVPAKKKRVNEKMAEEQMGGANSRRGGSKKNAIGVQPAGKRNNVQKQKPPGLHQKRKGPLGKKIEKAESQRENEDEVEPKSKAEGEGFADGSELSPFKFVFWNNGRINQETENADFNDESESQKPSEDEGSTGNQKNVGNIEKSKNKGRGTSNSKPKQKISTKANNKGHLGATGDKEKQLEPEVPTDEEKLTTGIFNLLWGRKATSQPEMDADENTNTDENAEAETVNTAQPNLPSTNENEQNNENDAPTIAPNEDIGNQNVEEQLDVDGGNDELKDEESEKVEAEADQSHRNIKNFFQVVWKAPSTKGGANRISKDEEEQPSTSETPVEREEESVLNDESDGDVGKEKEVEEKNENDAEADTGVDGRKENNGGQDEDNAEGVVASEAKNENEVERDGGLEGGNGDDVEGGDDGENIAGNFNTNQFINARNMFNHNKMDMDRNTKYEENKHHHHHHQHHYGGGPNIFGNRYDKSSYFRRPPPPPPPPPSQRHGSGKSKIAFKGKTGPRGGNVPSGRNEEVKRRGKG